MATKQTTLIGREIVIDFHGWDFERVAGQARAEKVASICEHGTGAYRVVKDRDGHRGEIVSHSDEGYRVLFEDGKLGDVHEMFFSVLPKKPERKGWKYLAAKESVGGVGLNLDKLGADGWELVTANLLGGTVVYIFKQPA